MVSREAEQVSSPRPTAMPAKVVAAEQSRRSPRSSRSAGTRRVPASPRRAGNSRSTTRASLGRQGLSLPAHTILAVLLIERIVNSFITTDSWSYWQPSLAWPGLRDAILAFLPVWTTNVLAYLGIWGWLAITAGRVPRVRMAAALLAQMALMAWSGVRVFQANQHPLAGMSAPLALVSIHLKLYSMIDLWTRPEHSNASVSLRHLLYSMLVPQLVFQWVYPRQQRNPSDMLRYALTTVVALSASCFVMVTLGMPIVHTNTQLNLHHVLQLVPWVAVAFSFAAYGLFEGYLPLMAEVFGLQARDFALDYWNCRDWAEFWRLWNRLVHHWFATHMLRPLLKLKLSKPMCIFVAFIVSGLLHELVFILVFHKVTFIITPLFLAQVPLMVWRNKSPELVNKLGVWVGLLIAQQVTVAYFYHTWFHQEQFAPAAAAAAAVAVA